MAAARFNLTGKHAIEQGASWSILVQLPGDWRNHQFAGQIRRVPGGPVLAVLRFGVASFATGFTSLPVFLNAGDLVVGGNGVFDIEAIAPNAGVARILQGQVEISPQVTVGGVTDPASVVVNDALAVRLVLRMEAGGNTISVVHGEEAIAAALILHNTDPSAHGGIGQSDIAYSAAIAISALRALTLNPAQKAVYADPGDAPLMVVGVSTTSAIADQNVVVRNTGEISDSGWNWNRKEPIFLGSGGALTQLAPVTGARQLIGLALTPTKIQLQIEEPIYL